MATDRKIRNFLKRWNISLDEQVEFEKFRNRIIKAVDTYVGTRYITNYAGMVQEFERIIGSEPTKCPKCGHTWQA